MDEKGFAGWEIGTDDSKNPSAYSGKKAININTVNDYVFVEQAYKGSGGFKDNTYLVPHGREAFYGARQAFSRYTNFINPILQAMVDPVFNALVHREHKDNELFEMFLADTNYNDLKIQDFTRLVTKYIRLHSVSFVVMDYILPKDVELSEKDLLKGNHHPYVYMKKAQEVESSKLDFFGRLEEIVFFDVVMDINLDGKLVKKSRRMFGGLPKSGKEL